MAVGDYFKKRKDKDTPLVYMKCPECDSDMVGSTEEMSEDGLKFHIIFQCWKCRCRWRNEYVFLRTVSGDDMKVVVSE